MMGSFSQIQSTSNAAVSRGLLFRSKTEQGLKSGHGLITPIMAKDKLIEVNLELRAADPMVGTDQPLLEVADSTVGQGHYRFDSLAQFGGLRLHPRDVPIPGIVQTRKTLQRIGVDRRAHSECCWIKPLRVVALKSGITAIRTRPDALPRFSTAAKTRAVRRPLS